VRNIRTIYWEEVSAGCVQLDPQDFKWIMGRVKKLEKALEFYANGYNYTDPIIIEDSYSIIDKKHYRTVKFEMSIMHRDHGRKAKEALEENNEES